MNLKSKYVSKNEINKDLVLLNQKKISIFQTPKWLKILSEAYLIQSSYITTKDENGEVLCYMPILRFKKFIFNFFGSPIRGLFTSYMGPIYTKKLDKKVRENILISQHNLIKNSADYIEIVISNDFHPDREDMKILKKFGYTYASQPTSEIDVTVNKEIIWKNFKSRARNMIRKSLKKGVKINFIQPDENWMMQFYNMLSNTYSRQKLSIPHPFSFYKKLLNLSEKLLCLSATYKEKDIAKAIYLVDGNRIIFFSGTSNIDGMKLAANSLIQWEALKYSCDNNKIIHFDFGGLGNEKIDKFKDSFSGKIIHHHRWTYQSLVMKIVLPIVLRLRELNIFNISIKKI